MVRIIKRYLSNDIVIESLSPGYTGFLRIGESFCRKLWLICPNNSRSKFEVDDAELEWTYSPVCDNQDADCAVHQ
jgi:hypothetical protein